MAVPCYAPAAEDKYPTHGWKLMLMVFRSISPSHRMCSWILFGGILTIVVGAHAQVSPPTPDGAPAEPARQATLGNPIPLNPAPPVGPPAPEPQAPFTLAPEQEQRLKAILHYWEMKSDPIKTFSCHFQRYTYNTTFGPPRDPKTICEGVIRYSKPDKGEFKVEHIREYTAPKEAGGPPQYTEVPHEDAEHWICDGASVFQLDGRVKQLIERKLPPELQGQEIAEGPLPFIFGASQAKIEARYWLRELQPPPGRAEYCIEAYPKRREDAASFQKVRIILDQKSFLPQALEIFLPEYNGKDNLAREVYKFSRHEKNSLVHNAQEFLNQFISPKVPLGWKKIVENYDVGGTEEPPQAARRMGPVPPPGYEAPR